MDLIPLAQVNLHELSLSSNTGRASGTPGKWFAGLSIELVELLVAIASDTSAAFQWT